MHRWHVRFRYAGNAPPNHPRGDIISAVISLLCTLAITPQSSHTFAITGGQFMLDNKPLQIVAGEMHYPRIPEAYWKHRIQMAKAMGLNAITIYTFWNYHETEQGKFNFRGNADVAKFVRLAKDENMWVVLRPGPYVCAEWEYGGYPYWLQTIPGMAVRTDNKPFLDASQKYLNALAKELAPLQVTHGGNILLVQVENEYGSFDKDHVFMRKNMDAVRKAGFDVPLFTADGEGQMPGGHIDGVLPGWNGGGYPHVKEVVDKFYPGGPYFVPELYPGWLCHWSERFPRSDGRGVTRNVDKLLRGGASLSLYMFHGGTNFGFWNGANFGGVYQPHTTTYDYDAPCDEAGNATPKYMMLRGAINKARGVEPIPVPAPTPKISISSISLTPIASVLDFLPKPMKSAKPMTFEALHQGYGFVLYRHTMTGSGRKKLTVEGVRDYAIVMVNGKTFGTLDRRRREKTIDIEMIGDQPINIDILVENGGRINYGQEMRENFKGILGAVTLDGRELTGWQQFSLPYDRVPTKVAAKPNLAVPSIFRGEFTVSKVGDTYLDMHGWNKGLVWVNGHNLGRYWKIGPQQTLYCPGVWLTAGRNTVTVLESQPTEARTISGLDHAILDEAVAEPAPIRSSKRLESNPPLQTADLVATGNFGRGNDWKTVKFTAHRGRYLTFVATSSQAAETYASVSELELVDSKGASINRSKWKVIFTDSEETSAEDGSADNAIDGDVETIWHTVWSQDHNPLPHKIVIDLGQVVEAAGLRYLPRPGGERPAMTKGYQIYLSAKLK